MEPPSSAVSSFLIPQQRRVEKPCERDHLAEDRDQRAVEPRGRRKRAGEFGARDEMTVFQKLGGLVIFWKAARHAGQLLALERPDPAQKRRRLDDRAQLPDVLGDVLA